ncbi:MAG TPA: flagellar basal body-associated FliL family protein, partial [Rhodobacterales bacterium]|nr:flagellar basal body-associated FliL family protein [Rhodobacterales bacterium]
DGGAAEAETGSDYVKLNNQFVVPTVKAGRIAAMVVLSISLEVPPGGSEAIYQREPKLRDLFLQVLFDHANAGGFDGAFTEGGKMDVLRAALLETAQRELGNNIRSVLITDMAKQDM